MARLAKRDFKQVYDDVERLKEFGLLKATKSKRGVPTKLKAEAETINVQIAV